MKILILAQTRIKCSLLLIVLYSMLCYSCSEEGPKTVDPPPSNSNKISDSEYLTDEVKLMEQMSNDSSAQLLFLGNCSYYLEKPENMYAQPDSLLVGSTRVLVIYHLNQNVKSYNDVMLYSSVYDKQKYEEISFNEYINKEGENAIMNNEEVKILKNISISDNQSAILRQYVVTSRSEYYAVAYIDAPECIITITLSTKDLRDFKEYFTSFETLVKSFKFLGIKMYVVE